MMTAKREKPLVLVADDDITVRMIAAECLEQAGFDVEGAENGHEALTRVADLQPDAVLLDVLMPEMNGFEACKAIRAMPGNKTLPVLMMTALDDVESIDAAYRAGASEFTTKPVNWQIEAYRLKNMIRFSDAVRQVELSRQEWERTFNALDELVIIYDREMTIVQANNAAIAAARSPASSLSGKSCSSAFGVGKVNCAECPIRQALQSNEKVTTEWSCECFGGSFLVSVFPVMDADGNFARSVCLAKDITEQKRMDNELRCAQKMDAIGTLAGGLAHDFNNLLQIVVGYAESSLYDFSLEKPLFENLEAIRDAARRGGEITRQLMAVGRNVESQPVSMGLNHVVKEVAALLSRTIPKNISIKLHLEEDLSSVYADPAQMEQVIMNLSVNAKHAMPDGGELLFETRNIRLDPAYCRAHPNVEPGEYAMLSVTDTGCGMDEETQARIFEPFFTTRDSDKGTGLGLAMVYGIVKKHMGHTSCYSELGEGTTFKIYIPVVHSKEKKSPVDEADDQLLVGGDETLLLVDDEPDIRSMAKKLLLRAGYRVFLAGDGREALDILEQEAGTIDLVILDLNMPVMGGLACLEQMQHRGLTIPVLFASGFALNEKTRSKLCDSAQYLSKPFQGSELLQKLRSMLNARV